MTNDLGSAVEILRRAVGLPDVPRMSGVTLLTPNAAAAVSQKRLSRLFERGELAPPKLGSSLEILVAGRAVALLLVHVFVDARETVPVGIVTDHPPLVARLDAQIRDDQELIWNTKPRKRDATEVSPPSASLTRPNAEDSSVVLKVGPVVGFGANDR
jgi:hypothetical protein